ncbi:MAG: DUF4129 domain-containing protein [Micromonosporaceae bacterium]|nr:DUF4129 domain-containing protein [Micromonosporaceae bacterium]
MRGPEGHAFGGLRRLWPLAAVAALLAVAALAAALSAPQVTRVPVAVHTPDRGNLQRESPFTAPGAPHLSAGAVQQPIQLGWLGTLLGIVCGVVVLAIVGVLIFFLLRSGFANRRGRLLVEARVPEARPVRREEVIAAVDAGLADLDDDDSDPRRAVIACWVRLEQAAAAAGTPRQPGDSPTDLVVRLLGAHQVSAAVLYRLADVYRLARYATHTVDTGMREAARSALRQLRDELTHSRSGPLEYVP